jgi:hypothetical protein
VSPGPKIFVFFALVALMASCHGGCHPAPGVAKGYHLLRALD